MEKLPQIKKDEVDFFFDVLDDDRSGTISKSEFFDFVDILQYSFVKIRTTTYLERNKPAWAASDFYRRMSDFVHSDAFARTTTLVLAANTIQQLIDNPKVSVTMRPVTRRWALRCSR